jgi:hypothetical protein
LSKPVVVDVWVVLDVGKEEHLDEVLDDDGEPLFARPVVNDQAAVEALMDRGAKHGTPGPVMPSSSEIRAGRAAHLSTGLTSAPRSSLTVYGSSTGSISTRPRIRPGGQTGAAMP